MTAPAGSMRSVVNPSREMASRSAGLEVNDSTSIDATKCCSSAAERRLFIRDLADFQKLRAGSLMLGL